MTSTTEIIKDFLSKYKDEEIVGVAKCSFKPPELKEQLVYELTCELLQDNLDFEEFKKSIEGKGSCNWREIVEFLNE